MSSRIERQDEDTTTGVAAASLAQMDSEGNMGGGHCDEDAVEDAGEDCDWRCCYEPGRDIDKKGRAIPLLDISVNVRIAPAWHVCYGRVYLLGGPDEKCTDQQIKSCKAFQHLGFNVKFLYGLHAEEQVPHPRSYWSWRTRFIPKLICIADASNMREDEWITFGEDSCWPVDCLTPDYLHSLLRDCNGRNIEALWLGACGANKKTSFRHEGRQEWRTRGRAV